jgi:hypothetical protein
MSWVYLFNCKKKAREMKRFVLFSPALSLLRAGQCLGKGGEREAEALRKGVLVERVFTSYSYAIVEGRDIERIVAEVRAGVRREFAVTISPEFSPEMYRDISASSKTCEGISGRAVVEAILEISRIDREVGERTSGRYRQREEEVGAEGIEGTGGKRGGECLDLFYLEERKGEQRRQEFSRRETEKIKRIIWGSG